MITAYRQPRAYVGGRRPTEGTDPQLLRTLPMSRSPRVLSYGDVAARGSAILRGANNYAPRWVIAPLADQATIAALDQQEFRAYLKPGSWLHSIMVTSDQTNGFALQIVNVASNRALFNRPLLSNDLKEAGTVPKGTPGKDYRLPLPLYVGAPGVLLIRIVNLQAGPQTCRVVLKCCEPIQLTAPNDNNRRLDEAAASIVRAGRADSPGVNSNRQVVVPGSEPWNVQGPGAQQWSKPGVTVAPAPGSSAIIWSELVPEGRALSIRGIMHRVLGAAAAFNEGSGDLFWTLSIDGIPVPGLEAITTQRGTGNSYARLSGAIRAHSGQRIEYKVTAANFSQIGTGTYIEAAAEGWTYPQE